MTASPKSTVAASNTPAWDRLEQFLTTRRTSHQPAPDLEAFEKELHTMFAEAEAEAMGEELSRFDVDLPAVKIDGVMHRQVLRCEQTYMAAAGPVKVTRSLYSTRQDGERAVCPMELRAGIIAGYWSPRAAKQATFTVTHLPPQEAETLFAQIGNMCPSKSSLDRLPKQLRTYFNRPEARHAITPQTRCSMAT